MFILLFVLTVTLLLGFALVFSLFCGHVPDASSWDEDDHYIYYPVVTPAFQAGNGWPQGPPPGVPTSTAATRELLLSEEAFSGWQPTLSGALYHRGAFR